jgi:TonB family protein
MNTSRGRSHAVKNPGRLRLGVGVLAISILGAPANAQDPIRVSWQLMDCVVQDVAPGVVYLLASPALVTTPSRDTTRLDGMALQSIQIVQWATVIRSTIDSLERHGQPHTLGLIGPPLPSLGGRAFIGVGYDPDAERGKRYFFLLEDSTTHHFWRSGGSTGDVSALLKTFETAAQQAGLVFGTVADTTPVLSCAREESCAQSRPKLIFSPPLKYPRVPRREGKQGRVWLQFIVDTSGLVDSASIRVLLSDGADFTDQAIATIVRAKFAPATVDGRPISVRSDVEFRFRLGR